MLLVKKLSPQEIPKPIFLRKVQHVLNLVDLDKYWFSIAVGVINIVNGGPHFIKVAPH